MKKIIKLFLAWLFASAIVCGVIFFSGGGMDFVSKPVGATYLILWAVWILVMVIFRNVGEQPTPGRRTFSFLMTIGMLLLLILPSWEYAHLSGPLPRNGILSWLGLSIFAFGIFLQYAAMQTLQKGFTSGQKVVTNGPYGIVRHPGTIGHLLSMAGIGLSLSSLSAMVLAILFVPLLIKWIKDEEETLISEYKDEYRNYKQKTRWRMVPLIY